MPLFIALLLVLVDYLVVLLLVLVIQVDQHLGAGNALSQLVHRLKLYLLLLPPHHFLKLVKYHYTPTFSNIH